MYELSVTREFCAAHAIDIKGVREPLHGHNWRVTAVVAGPVLDADGLLCDFHEVEAHLDAAIDRYRDRTLNDVAPFDQVNPTAEHLARHLAEALADGLGEGVQVRRLSVTEAPGCEATYIPVNP